MKYTPEQIAVAKAQVVAEAKWRAASGAKNGRWRVVRQIQDGKGQEQARTRTGGVRLLRSRTTAQWLADELNVRRDPEGEARLEKAIAMLAADYEHASN